MGGEETREVERYDDAKRHTGGEEVGEREQ